MASIITEDLGIPFVFTRPVNSVGPIASNQNGIPSMFPGDTVTIYENKLRPAHFSMVADGFLTVSPNLPPDLVRRARSMNWQDTEWRSLLDTMKQQITKLLFDANAPTVGTAGTPIVIDLFAMDSTDKPILLNSEIEVDISVSAGVIVDVTGYISGTKGGVGPIRAKMSSGKISITVNRANAGAQTISLANVTPAGITITDTHVITWS
jgi:hypothetical protein